jgi:hypothetical protein
MEQIFGAKDSQESGSLTGESPKRAWVKPALERLSLKEALGSNVNDSSDSSGASGS